MPALYIDALPNFVTINVDELLGKLTTGLAREGFDTTPATTFSWLREIRELQRAFRELIQVEPAALKWAVLFEYILPVVGQRIDCVLLANDVIYVIEYKSGSSSSARGALGQAQDYALNLLDFHEGSKDRVAVPIAVGTFSKCISLNISSQHQGAAVDATSLATTIVRCQAAWAGQGFDLDPKAWDTSRYFPIPTIIEAASAIYRNHDVRNLARSKSGSENLETTQQALEVAVQDAITRQIKKLILVTGVPGAGKTLAGLNAVQSLAQKLNLNLEQAAFLSGNSPLVAVIQTALKRSVGSRKRGVAAAVRSRVREVHRFVRDSFGNHLAPVDRLIVFDEAQRAWTAARNKKKFGRDISEPEMILEIMGRHNGWAVVIALVGGGQEIHSGEAGLAAWGDAILKHSNWEVDASPEALVGGPSVAGSRLFRDGGIADERVRLLSQLHLSVSKRSFTSEVTAAWVNAVLDGRCNEAELLAARGLPVYITRDIEVAREWLRSKAKGRRRCGLVASSGAARLRADGVETPTFQFLRSIDYVKWFLEAPEDHRSSNQLEIALSEFELQGLELDLVGVLWGGDLIFQHTEVVARSLKGRKWCVVRGTKDPQKSADDPRTRIQNKYRVLLTRFRKAMIIYVPVGSNDDSTRGVEDFESVHTYLLSCGVRSLPDKEIN